MTSVIIVLPKPDDAKNIKNLLTRNGIPVAGALTTGSSAIAMADNLGGGIILCGYKLADMMYSQLHEDLPAGFEMLLMASLQIIEDRVRDKDIMCIPMPVKAHDLINTLDMMIQAAERRKKKLREKPKQRNEAEVKIIREAKAVLMNRNHMSEEEAHRYIQKCSMDSGTNLVETAQMILVMVKG